MYLATHFEDTFPRDQFQNNSVTRTSDFRMSLPDRTDQEEQKDPLKDISEDIYVFPFNEVPEIP